MCRSRSGVQVPGPKVMVGMPIGSGSLPWDTAVSLMSTVRAADKAGIPIRVEAPTGCSVVQWARSTIVEGFLKTDFTHLFWIDADITWAPNDFFRILGFAGVLDSVGASYPFKKEPTEYLINLAGEPGKVEVNNATRCVRINSMAIGFTCMKRAVVEAVAKTKPRVRDDHNGLEYADVFRVDRTARSTPRGEDVAFYDDARELGFSAWLDPSVNVGHIGTKVYRGDVIDALGLQNYAVKEK